MWPAARERLRHLWVLRGKFFWKTRGVLHAAVQERGSAGAGIEGMKSMKKCRSREEAIRYLERLVFYQPNDGIQIAFAQEQADLKRFRLEGVTEFKRHANGTVELKFLDRLKALETLVRLQEEPAAEGGGLEDFLDSLSGGGEA